MLHIRKKDKVAVISGKNKGKQGEVISVIADDMTAIVSKLNIRKKHTRPTQTDPGGIKEIEAPISIANLTLICPKCDQKTRPKFDILSDGKKVRVCRKCGEMIL